MRFYCSSPGYCIIKDGLVVQLFQTLTFWTATTRHMTLTQCHVIVFFKFFYFRKSLSKIAFTFVIFLLHGTQVVIIIFVTFNSKGEIFDCSSWCSVILCVTFWCKFIYRNFESYASTKVHFAFKYRIYGSAWQNREEIRTCFARCCMILWT